MKILLADDDAISRKLLGRALERMGYQVLSVENGKMAWDFFQSDEIRFVITDWEMPEMDGITLCNRIRSHVTNWYCYIILITIKSEREHLKQVFKAGADDYISKPFNIDELSMRVKTGERIVNLQVEHNILTNTLIESRNKLKTVFDSMIEEIVVLDKFFAIRSANKQFINKSGRTFKEVIGISAFALGIDLFCDETKTAVEEVFRSGKDRNFLLRTKDIKGESLVKDIQCIPVENESGTTCQVVFTARDITEERKKTEAIKTLNEDLNFAMAQVKSKNEKLEEALKQIKSSQAQILQSEKMASIGQLAAGVAHEINNPTGFVSSNLKTLSGYIEDLLGLHYKYRQLSQKIREIDMENDSWVTDISRQMTSISDTENDIDIEYLRSDIPELIEESRDGMDRIRKIVMDLKDFAHPEDDRKLADINECIESTLNIVWNEIKYTAKLEKHYEDIPSLFCYPRQLNQVFMNLLVNAAQAIEENGVIEIHTGVINNNARIVIRDTGKGIPQENISKIFDPFFTTKPVGKGTGLGLNLVYNIIKKHDGKISVESELGKGTTFTIDIPLKRMAKENNISQGARIYE